MGQADMISKLGKEKRSVGDGRQKTEEDIQAAEDKCNHLSKVKGKLEQALDESEDGLEREKKVKGDVEKAKRKVEGDLKLTQEAVSDLDRVKAEKSRTMLKKDIEDIASRLEEAGSSTATQVELNKKREAELGRIKAELEELNIAQEGTLAALRMKHNNTMGDLGEQIDSLNSSKVKSEKDKAGMELDLRDARLDLEDAVKGKAELDKTGKLLQGSIVDSNTRLDEMARALNEAESTNFKQRLLKMKNLLMFFQPRLPMLKNQRADLDLTLMISPWNTREFMPQLLLLKSVQRTLTRSLVNGSLRLQMLLLRWQPLRMRAATTALSF